MNELTERLWEVKHLSKIAYKALRVAENQNDLNKIQAYRDRYWKYLDEQEELQNRLDEPTL